MRAKEARTKTGVARVRRLVGVKVILVILKSTAPLSVGSRRKLAELISEYM